MKINKDKMIRSLAPPSWRMDWVKRLGRPFGFGEYACKSPLNSACSQANRLLLIVIILAITPNGSGSASGTDDLYQRFQVDLPSADMVILVDASLSMKGHQYGDVRQAVINSAAALTDQENLHLRVFGDVASSPLEGKGSEVAASIEGYLPKAPLFHHTDLGLAILKGLDFLEREGASQVQAFYLFTDGLHQPPGDSPYSRDFAHDPNWQALQQRAQALCRQHHIFVYGFGLAQQTDIAVLRQVFPSENVELIVGNAAQAAQALQQVRERLRQTRLRQAIEQELAEGKIEVRLARNSIDEAATRFELPITIRNAYRHLPIRIERVDVQRASFASQEIDCALAALPADAVLAPGEQLRASIKGALRAELAGWRIGKAWQSYAATFEFVPVARFQSQALLDELEASPHRCNLDSASLAVSLRISHGIPYWALVAALLMITAGGGLAVAKVKRAKQRMIVIKQRQAELRRLAGTLKVWHARRVEPEGSGIDLSGYREDKLDIVMIEGDRLEVMTPGSQLGEVVARLSRDSVGDASDDDAFATPEFHIEPATGHRLAYESGGEMREAAKLTLCANDVLEMDGRWRLRYVNEKLRTRAEIESAQAGGA